jgi:glycosyltransferase involved in cell wall biosynthesis
VTKPLPLGIVIPVRNDAVRLGGCLASIKANPGADQCEIVVVDNGSDDDSAGVAARAGARVVSLPDVRAAAARNAGASATSAPLRPSIPITCSMRAG